MRARAQLAYSLIMAIIPLIMFLITLAGNLTLPVDSVYSYLEFCCRHRRSGRGFYFTGNFGTHLISALSRWFRPFILFRRNEKHERVTNKAFHTVERRAGWKFFLTSLVFAFYWSSFCC
jgi:uncharacterized BrkB/YihY/UPF0761 family membrane protein